jgi:Holliday junction resolvase RusA-like endonuclease
MKGCHVLHFGDAELKTSIQSCLPLPIKSGNITTPPDVDNLLKSIFDSLQDSFYSNNSVISKLKDVEKTFDGGFGGQEGYTIHCSIPCKKGD